MTFVADESIDREVVEKLRTQGFAVLYIADRSQALRTTSFSLRRVLKMRF